MYYFGASGSFTPQGLNLYYPSPLAYNELIISGMLAISLPIGGGSPALHLAIGKTTTFGKGTANPNYGAPGNQFGYVPFASLNYESLYGPVRVCTSLDFGNTFLSGQIVNVIDATGAPVDGSSCIRQQVAATPEQSGAVVFPSTGFNVFATNTHETPTGNLIQFTDFVRAPGGSLYLNGVIVGADNTVRPSSVLTAPIPSYSPFYTGNPMDCFLLDYLMWNAPMISRQSVSGSENANKWRASDYSNTTDLYVHYNSEGDPIIQYPSPVDLSFNSFSGSRGGGGRTGGPAKMTRSVNHLDGSPVLIQSSQDDGDSWQQYDSFNPDYPQNNALLGMQDNPAVFGGYFDGNSIRTGYYQHDNLVPNIGDLILKSIGGDSVWVAWLPSGAFGNNPPSSFAVQQVTFSGGHVSLLQLYDFLISSTGDGQNLSPPTISPFDGAVFNGRIVFFCFEGQTTYPVGASLTPPSIVAYSGIVGSGWVAKRCWTNDFGATWVKAGYGKGN